MLKKTNFILTHAYAGLTILLGSTSLPVQFIDGVFEYVGDDENTEKMAHWLAVNWQAYPEGHPLLLPENPDGDEVPKNPDELQTHDDLLSQGDPSDPVETTVVSEPNADSDGGQAGVLSDGNGQPAGVAEAVAVVEKPKKK